MERSRASAARGGQTGSWIVFAVEATASFRLVWPEATVSSRAELRVTATATDFDVDLTLTCFDGDDIAAKRQWQRLIPRDLG